MARNHAGAIPRSGVSARVVAYAEPDAEARQAFGDACPGAAAFHSPAEMLAEGDADVVHICTPPASHEALAREALEAGCHVYVEKPFAETRAGAERVLRDAAQRGLKVSAGHQR
jgi:predicted dehydrogenase